MANHPSAVKRNRQNEKRNANNQTNRHKLKTQLKKLKTVIAAGAAVDAKAILPVTISSIDKSVQKGVMTKNTARRHKSRLSRAVNRLPVA
jgi:small subunit ribosomal protein S20